VRPCIILYIENIHVSSASSFSSSFLLYGYLRWFFTSGKVVTRKTKPTHGKEKTNKETKQGGTFPTVFSKYLPNILCSFLVKLNLTWIKQFAILQINHSNG